MVTDSRITVCTASIPERWERLLEAAASLRAQTVQPATWLIRVEEPDEFGFGHIGRQRNALLTAIQTEWFVFLDDDDLLDPDYLEEVGKRMQPGVDVVYAPCRGHPHRPACVPFDGDELRKDNYICGVTAVRTATARAVGGFVTDGSPDDWGLWLRILDAGGTFAAVGYEMWTHRCGPWRAITRRDAQ